MLNAQRMQLTSMAAGEGGDPSCCGREPRGVCPKMILQSCVTMPGTRVSLLAICVHAPTRIFHAQSMHRDTLPCPRMFHSLTCNTFLGSVLSRRSPATALGPAKEGWSFPLEWRQCNHSSFTEAVHRQMRSHRSFDTLHQWQRRKSSDLGSEQAHLALHDMDVQALSH